MLLGRARDEQRTSNEQPALAATYASLAGRWVAAGFCMDALGGPGRPRAGPQPQATHTYCATHAHHRRNEPQHSLGSRPPDPHPVPCATQTSAHTTPHSTQPTRPASPGCVVAGPLVDCIGIYQTPQRLPAHASAHAQASPQQQRRSRDCGPRWPPPCSQVDEKPDLASISWRPQRSEQCNHAQASPKKPAMRRGRQNPT